MGKKIVNVISVIQLVLSIVAYISMSIHFNTDVKIYTMLENIDTVSTLLRLSLYAIPGIHILSGLYGLVFYEKKIIILMGFIELASCISTFSFVGSSNFMLVQSIVAVSLSLIYIVFAFRIKDC